ncbi:MAG: MATE family efflux transporter [Sedimentitalea sp.]
MAEPGRFLTGSTMGHVARMTMTGAMGITFVFLVDAANLFWISQLGDPRLVAAIGFAFAIQYFSVSAGIGLMMAATALISRGIGAGTRDLARRHATSAALIAFLVQSVMAAFIITFRHDIVATAGATGETAALAARYLAISVPSLGVMALAMIANGALRAEGDGRRSMFVTLTSGGVAMVIDPILIVTFAMGLDGAAIGLVLSRCVMLVMALHFSTRVYDLLAWPRWGDIKLTLRPYLYIAIPAILTQMATPVGNYLMTTVMARFGDDAVAGWAVVGRLTVVAFGGIFSLSGAIGGIFGQNYGAGQMDRLQSIYRDAILFGLMYTVVTWALLVLAGPLVIDAFALSELGGDVVTAFTWVGAGGFVFAAALFVSNSAFNALGRPAWSTLTNWVRDGLLTLPAALWLAGVFGAVGVIYAQALVSVVVGAIAAWWGWRYVQSLSVQAPLDLDPARPYAHADRFRRR